jgi:hypothetical protein
MCVGIYVEGCQEKAMYSCLFQLCIWFSNVCIDLYPRYKISSFTCNHQKEEKNCLK